MLLSELVASFLEKYRFECELKNLPRKIVNNNLIALLLSEVVNDVQKDFGVIQFTLPITLVSGTDKYDLTASFMEDKSVAIGDLPLLTRKSVDWMLSRMALSGYPQCYTILYSSAIPKIWIYPNPTAADTMTINYTPNFNLFSPSTAPTTVQDFGDFLKTTKSWSGNTVFPTQYDKLMLYGLLKQVITDYESKYDREKALLLVKQFNGEKIDYDPEWGE